MENKREFIHACYVKSKDNQEKDAVFIKENVHYPDGTVKGNLRRIENYQQPFYLTKPEFRNYLHKKETESINRVERFYSNRAQLPSKAFKLLHGYTSLGYVGISTINASPYIYGSDITPPTLLHKDYREKYGELFTPSTMAVLDFETDVIKGNGDIISGILSFKDRVHVVITKDFLSDIKGDVKDKILKLADIHLKDYIKTRNITFKIDIVDTPANAVIELMRSAHEWKPDYIGIWNIAFDINKMLSALDKASIDPAMVFSDPSVPNEFKYFHWREDTPFKIKADGSKMKKHVSELWNVATAPATFQFVCLMATFRLVRARDPQRNSYSLDSVLHDYLDLGKLKFENIAEGLTQLDWHIEMQKHHKLEYIIYMMFDGIGPELLDELTGDISKSLRAAVGLSEFKTAKSNPKRLADDMHFFTLENNMVLGSTSKDMTIDLDSNIPSINQWIITLPAELEHDIGVNIINEYPNLSTNITTHSFDVDVESSYPQSDVSMNTGKSTCYLTLCKIDGYTESRQRAIGLNLTSVTQNALSLAKDTYNFPDLENLLNDFTNDLELDKICF